MQYGAINIDPETMGGTPVFSGTRVSIEALFDFLKANKPVKEFLENFPSVSHEQVLEVLDRGRVAVTTEIVLEKFQEIFRYH